MSAIKKARAKVEARSSARLRETDGAMIYFPRRWLLRECLCWLRVRDFIVLSGMSQRQRACEQGFTSEIIGGILIWAFRLFRK